MCGCEVKKCWKVQGSMLVQYLCTYTVSVYVHYYSSVLYDNVLLCVLYHSQQSVVQRSVDCFGYGKSLCYSFLFPLPEQAACVNCKISEMVCWLINWQRKQNHWEHYNHQAMPRILWLQLLRDEVAGFGLILYSQKDEVIIEENTQQTD